MLQENISRRYILTLIIGAFVISTTGNASYGAEMSRPEKHNARSAPTGDEKPQGGVAGGLCGNNEIDPGEACDLGGQNDNALGCTPDCQLEYCGDGVVNNAYFGPPGSRGEREVCDSGELQGESCQSLGFSGGQLGCLSSCTFDVSSCTGEFRANRVFVLTGQQIDGASLQSAAHADNICQSAVDELGLGGDWIAWFSDNQSNILDRMILSDNPYVLLDYSRVANAWWDLIDGALNHGIYVDQYGEREWVDEYSMNNYKTVYTGTNFAGGTSPHNCNNWSSNSEDDFTTAGVVYSNGNPGGSFMGWWTDLPPVDDIDCDRIASIYCFEQVSSDGDPKTCAADIDGNNVVDADDLISIILNWYCHETGCSSNAYDITGDGAVDVDDLLEVILNWGPCN